MKVALYLVVFVVFLTTIKSINLLSQPLYLDEGLYIFWAKLFSSSSGFAYVSMQDGKTPLFMWIVAYFHQYLGTFLFTARFISVVSGSVTVLSWAIITYKLFGTRTTVFFCILMAASPYMFLVDRMALVDSMMVGFASVSFLWLFLARKTVILVLASGIFLGLSYLTKSSAKMFLVVHILVGACWVLELFKQSKKQAIALSVGLVVLVFVYFEIQGYLHIGAYQFWAQMAIKEAQLTYSSTEAISNLLSIHFWDMLRLNLEYLSVYALSALILAGVGMWRVFCGQKNYWLIIYPVAIFFAIAIFGKVNASRYLYSMIPSLMVLSSVGAVFLWRIKPHLVLVLIGLTIVQSSVMLISPVHAPYSRDDRSYFFKSNLSATGLSEVVNYLKSRSVDSVVGVTGVWGVLEGSQTVLDDAHIKNINIDPWRANLSRLLSSKEKKYIYLTRGDSDLNDLSKQINFKIIKEFIRPDGGSKTYLLEITDN